MISGSYALEDEFDELSEEDASDRLLMLAEKMDRNGDHKVDKGELRTWIIQSLQYVLFSHYNNTPIQ